MSAPGTKTWYVAALAKRFPTVGEAAFRKLSLAELRDLLDAIYQWANALRNEAVAQAVATVTARSNPPASPSPGAAAARPG